MGITKGSAMHRNKSAFTLLEMVVALGLVGLVTFYVTDMLVRQNRAYTVVDEVTGAQQNLRAIGDLIEREARVTGFMIPEAGALCGYDNVNAPDIVFFTDSDPIVPANQTLADMVADVTAGYPGNTLTLSVPGTGQGVVLDGAAFYDTDANAVADSDFFEGGGVIVFDRSNPAAGTSCGVVTQVNGTNSIDVDWRIRAGVGLNSNFLVGAGNETMIPAGGDIVAVPAHWYAVVPAALTGTAAPQLWRDGMLIADDVEDLQFAAFYDIDGDGLVTANPEYAGSQVGPAYVSNAPAATGDNTELREIRVNFVVRTSTQDPSQRINPATALAPYLYPGTTSATQRNHYGGALSHRNTPFAILIRTKASTLSQNTNGLTF